MSILDREQPDGAISGVERPGSPRQKQDDYDYIGSIGQKIYARMLAKKVKQIMDEALREATGEKVLPRKKREEDEER